MERAYGELLAAFGDLVVADTRGEPADPVAGSTLALRRRYRRRRREVGAALDELSGDRLPAAQARPVAVMRAVLGWLDEEQPLPEAGGGGAGAPSTAPDPDRARRRALYRRYGSAATSIRFRGETLDRLTVLARLATEPEAATRRGIFESLETIWRVVDGDGGARSPYAAIARGAADRWAADGSPIDANAAALGLDPRTSEATLHEMLAAWRAVLGSGRVEPWDYWYTVGAAPRRLEAAVPRDRLLEVNHAYLAALGADPDALGIHYDVVPRPGRPPIPVAFSIGMGARAADQPATGAWTPRPPWVFATYETGGLGNLVELLHESGHALHASAVRTRPAYLESPPDHTAYAEGIADVLGWDGTEPAWQRRWLGVAAEPREALLDRYGSVMLDVCWALLELSLGRDPSRRANDVWTEITADGLGVEPHPEWSWWAMRGQLIDSPGYMANYALSAILAAAVRERVLAARGPWWAGDPGWYAFVGDALLAPGASRSSAELLEAFLQGPLTAASLLDDLRGSTSRNA